MVCKSWKAGFLKGFVSLSGSSLEDAKGLPRDGRRPAGDCAALIVLKGLPELDRLPSGSKVLLPAVARPDEAAEGTAACACDCEELLGCSSWTVLGVLWWAGWARPCCPRLGERTRLFPAKPASRDCVRLATESPRGFPWPLPCPACWLFEPLGTWWNALVEADMPGAEGVPGSCHAFSGASAKCAERRGDAHSGHAPWKGTTTGGCTFWGDVLLPEAPADSPVLARLAGTGHLGWISATLGTSLPALLLLIGCSTYNVREFPHASQCACQCLHGL